LVVFAVWVVVAQPSCAHNRPMAVAVQPERLREHVEALARACSPRDWRHPENLDRCADYIARQFEEAGAAVEAQPFTVAGKPYRNVIGRFAPDARPRVVVGAHYDACGEQPGADDNASGIAALIELAGLVGRFAPTCAVDLVAYTLEEPPFFRSPQMGSAVHAKGIAGDKAACKGVIVLEMVGYFSDERGSQGYPTPIFHLMYPSRGNFIGVVGRWDQGAWIKTVKVGMKGATDLPVYSVRAPAVVPGVALSDHMSYWPYGINALMVTDTAFYRNKAYHTAGDTPESLDYDRMAKVVVAVFGAITSPE